ncbi:hypothetical protein SH203_01919 [Brevundimonas sp. SH203]|uniref:DUF7380 domain-containing protein n=1 Tax=Brevundimonas sp. SH203 TaxID=345167 RepID=UPI0009C566E1|nr:hypothetical protein [Brevundimonas sp. SH203]GAW41511.1 hypothetical protein SH203_01919 [Brevundimonas sp. SH203]
MDNSGNLKALSEDEASAADVEAIDFEEAIKDSPLAEAGGLDSLFIAAGKTAEADGDAQAVRVFRLLGGVCSFHFKPSDPAEPFGSMFSNGQNRSPIPSDYRNDQASAALTAALKKAKHPGLRARLADTLWLNDKKNRSAAEAAISGYIDCASGLIEGALKPRFGKEAEFPYEGIDLLRRALRIARNISGRGDLPANVVDGAKAMLAATTADLGCWLSTAKLCFQYDIFEPLTIAVAAEQYATTSADKDPTLLQRVWQLAAAGYKEAKDQDNATRCEIEAAEQLVRMARQMNGMASASWLMDAINTFRRIRGTRERRKILEAELRESQKDALDQMGSVSHRVDLTELVEATLSEFEGLSLGIKLGLLADLARSRPMEDLKKEALKISRSSPLSSLFGTTRVDAEGKVIFRSPGGNLDGNEDEQALRHTISRNQGPYRQTMIAGQFEPVRRHIASLYALEERHFMPIVSHSPFVPPENEYIFALGFARMMQGDAVSATHILLPQLENSLRYVLKQVGTDPSMIQSDLIQEDRSISALLSDHRDLLGKLLSEPVIDEIDLIFHDRAGPALRHEMAHGKITTDHCFSYEAKYACWFIYRLTCMRLFEHWNDHIVPAIEREI